jgi:hypothetical protein
VTVTRASVNVFYPLGTPYGSVITYVVYGDYERSYTLPRLASASKFMERKRWDDAVSEAGEARNRSA